MIYTSNALIQFILYEEIDLFWSISTTIWLLLHSLVLIAWEGVIGVGGKVQWVRYNRRFHTAWIRWLHWDTQVKKIYVVYHLTNTTRRVNRRARAAGGLGICLLKIRRFLRIREHVGCATLAHYVCGYQCTDKGKPHETAELANHPLFLEYSSTKHHLVARLCPPPALTPPSPTPQTAHPPPTSKPPTVQKPPSHPSPRASPPTETATP